MKKWYQSRTLWVNALLIIAGVSTAIAGELEAGTTVTFTGVVNIFLRIATSKGLTR